MTEDGASGALVEALVRMLQPAGAFQVALKQAGIDTVNVAARYPAEQWDRMLRLTRQHAFGTLEDDDDAYRQVGRALIDGFLTTFTGRLLGAVLPLMSPASFLAKTPFYMRLGRSDVTVTVGATCQPVRLTLLDPHNTSASISAGIIERCLERIGVAPVVAVVPVDDIQYHLDVSWH